MQSSGALDCTAFQADKNSKQVIKGNYVCQGSEAKPGGAGTSPSGSSSSTSKGGAAATDFAVPAVVGGVSLMAGLLQAVL